MSLHVTVHKTTDDVLQNENHWHRPSSGRSKKPRAKSTSTSPSTCHPPTPGELRYVPLQSSSHAFHTNIGSGSHVTHYSSDNHFGLVVVAQMMLKGSIRIGRAWDTSSAILTTIHGISFHNLITHVWNLVPNMSDIFCFNHNNRVHIQNFHTLRQNMTRCLNIVFFVYFLA